MKKIYNCAFRIVCVYIFILTIFSITTIDFTVSKSDAEIENLNGSKQLESYIITGITNVDNISNNINEVNDSNNESEFISVPENEKVNIETTTDVVTDTKQEIKSTYTYVSTIDTSAYQVLDTISGSLSHYGHDCYGCTGGMTSSGYDISDGRIYYTDPTFGSVRIVAAGYEYAEGTILRLTNVESTPIIAIVLDRGGAIGIGKKFTLDLLTESNQKAYELGTRYNVQIEKLRNGY